ncbi:MAG: HAD family hydrolase [Clostridia bacterium]|nr:HAD family hydrolase [Clostridia bacterium]
MHSISLIATDLDGTLLYDRGRITPRDRAMLTRVREAGIPLVFATGRDLRLILPVLDRLKLWDEVRYIIHTGGSGLYDVKTRTDRCLAELSPETLRDIYAKYASLPLSFLLTQDDIMHTNRMTDILRRESALLDCPIVEEPDFSAILTRPNGKLVTCGEIEDLESALPILTADPDPRYEFHRSHDNYIDCYVRGIGKGTALTTLCEMLSIPVSETLAIGDNLNDLQILETAGYSACPGDGHPGIFSVVDYIACPALEGAVADVCEHFLFEKDN